MKNCIKQDLQALMLVPGLSGYEQRVARYLKKQLQALGLSTRIDRFGNLLVQFPGNGPKVMLFMHMDQLGFVVRKTEADGFLRVERLGGVPKRALAGQPVLVCVGEGCDVAGVFANKSHRATLPEEKYKVLPYSEMFIDLGFSSAADVRAAGIDIGSPVVYFPKTQALSADRVAGTSIDDRAGCAVLLEVARHLAERTAGQEILIGIRPENFLPAVDGIAGEITVIEPTGSETHVVVRSDGQDLVSVLRERPEYSLDQSIKLSAAVEDLHVFDTDNTVRLNDLHKLTFTSSAGLRVKNLPASGLAGEMQAVPSCTEEIGQERCPLN